MTTYKADQGRLARMAAFWSMTLLALFGSTFLYELLVGIDAMKSLIGGITIPIVGIGLNGAFVISVAVFATAAGLIYRWEQKPKVADLLIDTESELRKVTWPTGQEVMNSSMVVIFCVVLIGAYLAGADYLLNRIMKWLLLGGA